MTALKLTAVALVGALAAPAVLAETGPEGKGRAAMLLETFAAIDADGNGQITQAEIEAHRTAMFGSADTNGDGVLNSDELAARELARFTESLPERTARMITRQDDNGDGSLSVDEIGESPLENRFARIDTDDDGAISQAEAEVAAERGGKRRQGHWGNWFN